MNKNLLAYAVLILVSIAGLSVLLNVGSHLQAPVAVTQAAASPGPGAVEALKEHVQAPLSLLLLQVVVIVVVARLAGMLFTKIKQPPVIGEMLAGILLGPSLLGMISPGTMDFLFPAGSLGTLKLFSQIGVVLFMFLVGMDLDLRHLREKAHSAVMVSHASIFVPLLLGVALALFLYRSYAPAGVAFSSFSLFMGVAMSITAFPVLARILEERGLMRTPLGNASIACAAVDDVTAWCLLAVVVAIVQASGMASALLTVGLAVGFVALMIFVVRPWVERKLVGEIHHRKGLIAGTLVFAFASAWATEMIGIHALFGAFLAGVVAPPQREFRAALRERLEVLVSVLLLPLFFVFTGLRTQVGLLNDGRTWLVCGAVIAVAVAGKLGGGMMAARWTGMSWLDSFSIGTLMNTRGLMELIVLNIGYDLGILSQKVFAIMVIMALGTTFMTGPLLELAEARRRTAEGAVPATA
ncbi:MAG TPA: cation:proton antiporter [Thermoanaerobaculia bacterium]|nr:cation:proton antiporter [Thermoanaerobaculia bacterium]